MDEPNPNAELIKSARRAQWACGLCLGLMFVMGLSGIASITLLHDDPLYTGSTGGIEGTTLEVVISLRWLIELLHEWGGYVGIVLAGWAALAVFSFARRIRRGDNLDWRRTARWVGPAGILGGGLIIASLLLLIASGVAAGGFVDHIGSRYNDDLSGIDKSTGLVDAREALQGYDDSQMAEMHVREFNYLLAIGALTLVMAAAAIRRVSKEAKADQSPGSTK
jgi:hypothetical protein